MLLAAVAAAGQLAACPKLECDSTPGACACKRVVTGQQQQECTFLSSTAEDVQVHSNVRFRKFCDLNNADGPSVLISSFAQLMVCC